MLFERAPEEAHDDGLWCRDADSEALLRKWLEPVVVARGGAATWLNVRVERYPHFFRRDLRWTASVGYNGGREGANLRGLLPVVRYGATPEEARGLVIAALELALATLAEEARVAAALAARDAATWQAARAAAPRPSCSCRWPARRAPWRCETAPNWGGPVCRRVRDSCRTDAEWFVGRKKERRDAVERRKTRKKHAGDRGGAPRRRMAAGNLGGDRRVVR